MLSVVVNTGQVVLSTGAKAVTSVAFSPDDKMLASGSDDGTASLWNVATHKQIAVLSTKGTGAVTSVAFSPDGKILATGSDDGTARLWNVVTDSQTGASLPAGTEGRHFGGLQPGRKDARHRQR